MNLLIFASPCLPISASARLEVSAPSVAMLIDMPDHPEQWTIR